MKLPNLATEPVAILVGAAIALALGLDLAQLAEHVERIMQLVVLVGGAALARKRVWPEEAVRREQRHAEERTRAELAPPQPGSARPPSVQSPPDQ